ncbi:hypothetical protein ACI2KR_07625 [Pseudomonas luteola]
MSDVKPSGGMPLYPLQYVIDKGNEDNSYVICRNLSDNIVVFKLNPPEEARLKAQNETDSSVPQLKKFSETHKKAHNPCNAHEDNNKKAPYGIFLGEQVAASGSVEIEYKGETIKVQCFEGRWASVLRDGLDGFRAPMGYGYLEVNFGATLSPAGNEQRLQYEEMCNIVKNADRYPDADLVEIEANKSRLAGALRQDRKKWFVGVLIHAQNTIGLNQQSVIHLRSAIQTVLERYTKKGVYGGAIIRVRKDKIVQTALCKTCDHQYDAVRKEVKNIDVILDDFMKYGGNRIVREVSSKGYVVDIIPTERFNCGKIGNQLYSKDVSSPVSKVMKTYVDNTYHADPLANIKKSHGFMYSRICMRLAETIDGSDNYLLSAIHSFSKPLGSILTIDKKGEPSFKLDTFARHDASPTP